MRLRIDDPASKASLVQFASRLSVALSPAWVRLALRPPIPRGARPTHGTVLDGHARSTAGKQARAPHQRGRLHVVPSGRETPYRRRARSGTASGSEWKLDARPRGLEPSGSLVLLAVSPISFEGVGVVAANFSG